MLSGGAGTLVTLALGSGVSCWTLAPPAQHAALSGDRDEGQVIALLPSDCRLGRLGVGLL